MNIERAQDIRSSEMWIDICKVIDEKIRVLEQSIRSCSVDKLPDIQIRIQLLEEIKRIPTDEIERQDGVDSH